MKKMLIICNLACTIFAHAQERIVAKLENHAIFEIESYDAEDNIIARGLVFNLIFSITANNEPVYLNRISLVTGSGLDWSESPGSSSFPNPYHDIIIFEQESMLLEGEYWRINSESTGIINFNVSLDQYQLSSGYYGISLNSVNWSDSPSEPEKVLNLNGFDSDLFYFQAIPEPSTLALGIFGIPLLLYAFSRKQE